jgi:hypothetical protein
LLFVKIKHYECKIIITVFAVFLNVQYVLNRINNINVSIHFKICNVRKISYSVRYVGLKRGFFYNYSERGTILYFFMRTELSLNISTNKLQERIELKRYQITRPYPSLNQY